MCPQRKCAHVTYRHVSWRGAPWRPLAVPLSLSLALLLHPSRCWFLRFLVAIAPLEFPKPPAGDLSVVVLDYLSAVGFSLAKSSNRPSHYWRIIGVGGRGLSCSAKQLLWELNWTSFIYFTFVFFFQEYRRSRRHRFLRRT